MHDLMLPLPYNYMYVLHGTFVFYTNNIYKLHTINYFEMKYCFKNVIKIHYGNTFIVYLHVLSNSLDFILLLRTHHVTRTFLINFLHRHPKQIYILYLPQFRYTYYSNNLAKTFFIIPFILDHFLPLLPFYCLF